MSDRRDFLKIFGISSAAMLSVDGKEKIERVESAAPTVPLGNAYPRVAEWLDIQKGKLYSALCIGGNTGVPFKSSHSFFCYSLGMYSPQDIGPDQATLGDTNLCRICSLSLPESFLVQRMGLIIAPSVLPSTRSGLVESYALELVVGNKIYQRVPLVDLFSVGEGSQHGELPDKGSISLDPLPLVLDWQASFKCNLVGTPRFTSNPVKAVKMWAVLEGLHARGVQ